MKPVCFASIEWRSSLDLVPMQSNRLEQIHDPIGEANGFFLNGLAI
jgi:hypothetical protein